MDNTARKLPQEGGHYTYADYKSWELAEGERYELIHGIPYKMVFDEAHTMAAPNDRHQAISGEIFRQLANHLRGKPCVVRSAPYDVRLFYAENGSDDTVVQPDISVICGDRSRGPEGARGAPSLIVEILSPSNTSEEYVRKFNLYLEAGVMEYWIVSPTHNTVQAFVLKDGAYWGKVYDSTAAIPSAALEGLIINLNEVFAE